MIESEREAKIAEVQAIGVQAKALLDRLSSDSPLHGPLFKICATIGRIEADLKSGVQETTKP